MAKRQTVTKSDRDRLMGIDGLVHCEGCPTGAPLVPANGPHEGLCTTHHAQYEHVSSWFNTGV